MTEPLLSNAERLARQKVRPLAGHAALVNEYIGKARQESTPAGAVRYVRARKEAQRHRDYRVTATDLAWLGVQIAAAGGMVLLWREIAAVDGEREADCFCDQLYRYKLDGWGRLTPQERAALRIEAGRMGRRP